MNQSLSSKFTERSPTEKVISNSGQGRNWQPWRLQSRCSITTQRNYFLNWLVTSRMFIATVFERCLMLCSVFEICVFCRVLKQCMAAEIGSTSIDSIQQLMEQEIQRPKNVFGSMSATFQERQRKVMADLDVLMCTDFHALWADESRAKAVRRSLWWDIDLMRPLGHNSR